MHGQELSCSILSDAGFGEKYGKVAVAKLFSEFLHSHDLLASKVKASDGEWLEYFLARDTGQFCQSDEGKIRIFPQGRRLSSHRCDIDLLASGVRTCLGLQAHTLEVCHRLYQAHHDTLSDTADSIEEGSDLGGFIVKDSDESGEEDALDASEDHTSSVCNADDRGKEVFSVTVVFVRQTSGSPCPCISESKVLLYADFSLI